MVLNSVSQIASHIKALYPNLTEALKEQVISIVETHKTNIENYVGTNIDSHSIDNKYVPPIVAFTKADVISLINAQTGGGNVKLGDLSINESGKEMSASQWAKMGEIKLKALGRGVQHKRSLS